MADIGNQLGDIEGAAERLVEALDDASIRMSSNASLQTRLSKIASKTTTATQKIGVQTLKATKAQLKNILDVNKAMTGMSKGLADFGKKAFGGMKKMAGGMMKAGLIGGLVVAVKFLIDGLLKVDMQMAKLSKSTGEVRSNLQGVHDAASDAYMVMGDFGITMQQTLAEATNLVAQFNSVHKVTSELVQTSLMLQTAYGVSAENAGQLVEVMTRANVNAKDFMLTVGAKTQAALVSSSLVMQDLAGKAQTMSIMTERNRDAMVEFAIQAAKAGTSLQAFEGIKGAFGSIEQISTTVGNLGVSVGAGFRDAMGDVQDLWMANQRGEAGRLEIQEKIQKGMEATFRVNQKGVLVMQDGSEILEFQKEAVEAMGVSWQTQERLQIKADKRKKAMVGMDAAQRKAFEAKETMKAKNKVREEERLNKLMNDRRDILTKLSDLVAGVFGRLTQVFSEILGIGKDTGPGTMVGMIDEFSDYINKVFDFPNLKAAVAAEGGGLTGIMKVMMEKAGPIFDDIGEMFGKALGKGISMISENYSWDWSSMSFAQTAESMGKDYREAKEREEQAFADIRASEKKSPQLQKALELERGKGQMVTKFKEGTEEETEEWKKYQAGIKDLEASIAYEVSQRKAYSEIITRSIDAQAKLAVAAEDIHGEDITQRNVDLYGKALGGFGGLSIVGEAGGEVVIGRSALRSGIGVSGRAASALAGIGVPGYQGGGPPGLFHAGAAGAQNVAGLAGDVGSPSIRMAAAAATMEETANQNSALVEFQRQEYDRRKQEAAEATVTNRIDDKKSWLDTAQKFFVRYNRQIDKTMRNVFGVDGGVGEELYKGVFTGMTAWAKGDSPKKALEGGVRAGLTVSLGKDGVLGKYFAENNSILAQSLQSGLSAFAAGGSMKQSGKALLGMGKQALFKKFAPGMMSMLGGGAATGRFVNSPTLMMVGEGGQNEVVIPTERIRKGLPINAGVARELGSIGVPGFQGGGLLSSLGSAFGMGTRSQTMSTGGGYGTALGGGKMGGWAMRSGQRFGKMGGLGGIAKGAGMGAAFSGISTFMQTGSLGQAGTAMAGAAIGTGVGAGLTALGVPPPLSGMIGNMVGGMAQKGLNKAFGLTGGYKKGRKKSVGILEGHLSGEGAFDFGAPSGLKKWMNRAIGGKEKVPTEKRYNSLVAKLGSSGKLSRLWGAGAVSYTHLTLPTKRIV